MSTSSLVAIVGRPNVGKSTLFNRLVGGRLAIIQNTPGVTRDRHYDEVEWAGHTFTVVDTGGYVTQKPTGYDKAIAQQVDMALGEAGVILLVVDGKAGVLEGDRTLANLLRRLGKPIFVVVNKTDNHQADLEAHSFHALGIEALYPISATHGTGTGDLLDAVVAALNTSQAPPSPSEAVDLPRITLLGKPNAGKSTLLNALLGTERQVVSSEPHTTRDAIDSYYRLFNHRFIITDTAGLRRKQNVKHDVEFYAVMRTLRAMDRADVCCVLVDAHEGFTDQDRQLVQLAWKKHKGVVILVNKWDSVDRETHQANSYRKQIIDALGPMWDLPILFISALHKQRIYQALERALAVYENRQQRVATPQLNKVVLQAVEAFPPPMKRGRPIEIKYATQLPRKSPTFALFCNHPNDISNDYKGYLVRKLRHKFTLSGVPVTLVFKKK